MAAPVTKTPPNTRKRKLDSTTAAGTLSQDSLPTTKASKTKHQKDLEQEEAALPATPQTLASEKPMDSEDEVNSVASSVDVEMDEDSSVDFGAGMFDLVPITCHLQSPSLS